MQPYIFRLPDVGEGVAEAEIVAWHVKVGDRIEEDQPTVDVMTDKTTVEMTTPVSGVVVAVHGEVGQMMPVGSPLVELALNGAAQALKPAPVAVPPAPLPAFTIASPPDMNIPDQPPAASAVTVRPRDEAPLASPATRKRAAEFGIALQSVRGTGPGGRITAEDLDAFIAGRDVGGTPATATRGTLQRTGINEIRIIGLRRRIMEKMQEAKQHIPHFGYVEEFDLTELEALRRELNDGRGKDQPKLTLLPFFMRAMVRLVGQFPQVNARFDDAAGILRTYDGVHIGIATQTAGGLLVPVVRHAEALDLWQSALALQRVTAAARDGSATREELSGSTITLTSLGALGGISATPIINHPEVAIVGPNKLMERPVIVQGQVAVRTMMNLSSSFDHRIVDGYDAARFVQGLKRLIERPALLFMEQ